MTLADDFQGFIFDLDGVIWSGEKLIPCADEAIKQLRKQGKTILFLTNNASKSRGVYAEKLSGFGINVSVGEIVTSGHVTAEYLTEKFGDSKIFVIGMNGLREELKLSGHSIVLEDPDFVVVGMDESFTYEKLNKVFDFIHYGNARLIAANDDRVAVRGEKLVPVAGSILASIEHATGVKARVCGKPYEPMIDFVLGKIGLPKNKVLMVGDNLDTDIAFGQRAGVKTALVLTGIHSRADARKSRVKPDYIINNLGELLK